MEGKWALSDWGRDEWSAIGIRELVNLVITCSTSLPRSDITVGSVSFDVGFFAFAFLPIFSPGPRGKREVGLVGTSSGLGLGKWGDWRQFQDSSLFNPGKLYTSVHGNLANCDSSVSSSD